MTVDDQTTRRSITKIRSSDEARKVINELLTRRKSNAKTVKEVVLNRDDGLRDTRKNVSSQEADKTKKRSNSFSLPKTEDVTAAGDATPRNTRAVPAMGRNVAGRRLIATASTPRISKSDTNLEQPLPELDTYQRSTSMTQLVSLPPNANLPRHSASNNDKNIADSDVKHAANAKSPGYYIRKMQNEPEQLLASMQNRPTKQKSSPAQRFIEAKLKSRSESCLLQSGKRRKQLDGANVNRTGGNSNVHCSPAINRRYETRDKFRPVTDAVDASFEPPRTKVIRERSFDMTFPGYDARYEQPLEVPQLDDVDKEIEDEFKKKSVDKCRRWMNRYLNSE